MLKIYGRNNSSNVMKVMWTVEELGLPCEREDVGMAFGRNDEPWYLAMNPNRLVPAIDDEGFTLWESNTIVRYLAAKYGDGTLSPHDPQKRADSERWMDWQLTTLNGPIGVIFWGLVRTPPEKRDMAVIQKGIEDCAKVWSILDKHLATRKFVGGDTLTIGDIPVGVMVNRWFRIDFERPPLPHLEAWFKRLCERPAYQKHILIPIT